MTPDLIIVFTGEELNMEHVIDGLMWTLHLTIYVWIISTSGFNNDLFVKLELQ